MTNPVTASSSRRGGNRAYTQALAEADCLIAELVCGAFEKAMRHRNRRRPSRAARTGARVCSALLAMAAVAIGLDAH